MHQRSFLATGTWVAIGLSTWTVAWIIAESIPVFNELLSLIVRSPNQMSCALLMPLQSALFGSWFSCKSAKNKEETMHERVLTRSRRPSCHFLACHEQRKVGFNTPKDHLDHYQPGNPSYRLCHCELGPTLFALQDCLLINSVWTGTLCLRQGHQREFIQLQLDMCQQCYLKSAKIMMKRHKVSRLSTPCSIDLFRYMCCYIDIL
jgi:hypothetical protein